jgi:hypothetical protein
MIEAPRGTTNDLAPYTAVTDVHGVDIYSLTLRNQAAPDLYRVGTWTATLTSITSTDPVWTTLQICAGGSWDRTTGAFVLPTLQQERYIEAHFTIDSDRKLVVRVPRGARSGPITMTSALSRRQTRSAFPIRPSARALPKITGTARVGGVLRGTKGAWYGDPPTAYRFRWLRCNRRGSACTPIRGATNETLRARSALDQRAASRARIRLRDVRPRARPLAPDAGRDSVARGGR